MNRQLRILLLVLIGTAMTQQAHATFWSTWFYFVFDPVRFAQQSLVYAETVNQNALASLQEASEARKKAEMGKYNETVGGTKRGNFDISKPLDAKGLKDSEVALRASGTGQDGKPRQSYDLYADRVSAWRIKMESVRAKTNALAKEGNSHDLTLIEWMNLQNGLTVSLAEAQAAKASSAEEQAAIKADLLRRRNRLMDELGRAKIEESRMSGQGFN